MRADRRVGYDAVGRPLPRRRRQGCGIKPDENDLIEARPVANEVAAGRNRPRQDRRSRDIGGRKRQELGRIDGNELVSLLGALVGGIRQYPREPASDAETDKCAEGNDIAPRALVVAGTPWRRRIGARAFTPGDKVPLSHP
jgi:hypothetical protein